MASQTITLHPVRRPFENQRRDAWWAYPLTFGAVLSAFGVYSFWAAWVNQHYYVEPYLSPFYSPCLAVSCAHVTIPIVGAWWILSPAFLVLGVPLGFRATCYYYRKSYYRSFFGSPPACAVADAMSGKYTGETRFPFILQNVHRYFFYLSTLVVIFLWWDAIKAFMFPEGFGIGVGTLVLTANAALLALYTFSCHSCRYMLGGHLDSVHDKPVRRWFWKVTDWLNPRHPQFAWVSLFGVALADLYVRLLSMGVISDFRFI